MPSRRTAQLIAGLLAVHPFGIDLRPRDAIAVTEPLQEVAVLAAGAAERRVRRRFGLAAQRAFLRFVRRFRHIRRTWGGTDWRASRQCRRAGGRAHRAM